MQVEVNAEFAAVNPALSFGGRTLLLTPPIDEKYWMMRVKVSDRQAVVAFPKFGTIGIGFQHEEDWNTNLPYTQTAEDLFDHISHNKGDSSISDDECIAAIRLLQKAIQDMMAQVS